MAVRRVIEVGLGGLLLAAALLAGSQPVAVSPGTSTGALIGDPCPTFSWGSVAGARTYDLVVYRLGHPGEEAEPVLNQRIAGSALGWTPSLDRCLERGRRYAWTVRAAREEETSGWSSPSFFQVASGPSETEFEEALTVVQRYLTLRGDAALEEGDAAPGSESRRESLTASPEPRAAAATQLSVDGGVEATSFKGDGSELTSLDPANLSAGTAGIDISGTAATASDLVGAAVVSESELDFDTATDAELSAHADLPSIHHDQTVDSVLTEAQVEVFVTNGPLDGTNFSNVTAVAGDSATGFFPEGQIEEALIADTIARDTELQQARCNVFDAHGEIPPESFDCALTVFVTTVEPSGNLGGLAGADGLCQSIAEGAGLVGTFKAWLSDNTDGPSIRFAHGNRPYELLDGTRIANDWADLTDGTIQAAIDMTETGALLGGRLVFSGTVSDGTPALFVNADERNCLEWTTAGSYAAVMGGSLSTDFRWSGAQPAGGELTSACGGDAHLYCFQQAGVYLDLATQAELDTHAGSADAHREHATLEESAEIDADIVTHAALPNIHHVQTVNTDTTCNGAVCDGTNFTNLQWSNVTSRPAGLDDGDDNTTYSAGPGLVLAGSEFSLGSFDASPATHTLTTLDSLGNLGWRPSITIGADGLGLISYQNQGSSTLKVAHCNDTACSSATTATLHPLSNSATSVTIGADGLGLISYWNGAGLAVSHCIDATCSSATTAMLDSTGFVGYDSSVTIGPDGLGLISYYHFGTALKVAHCSDLACSAATTTALDSSGDVGSYTSVTIGADGLGLISYYDDTNDDLKVAHCTDTACSSASTATLDSTGLVGRYTSITIGADGLGLISYYDETNSNLKVAHCSDTACSSATTYTLSNGGRFTSTTIGADGLGLISHTDAGGTLRVSHCKDSACSAATTTTLDSPAVYTSVTIGADGLALISYHDSSGSGDLKVAHCANVFCVPYFRRR